MPLAAQSAARFDAGPRRATQIRAEENHAFFELESDEGTRPARASLAHAGHEDHLSTPSGAIGWRGPCIALALEGHTHLYLSFRREPALVSTEQVRHASCAEARMASQGDALCEIAWRRGIRQSGLVCERPDGQHDRAEAQLAGRHPQPVPHQPQKPQRPRPTAPRQLAERDAEVPLPSRDEIQQDEESHPHESSLESGPEQTSQPPASEAVGPGSRCSLRHHEPTSRRLRLRLQRLHAPQDRRHGAVSTSALTMRGFSAVGREPANDQRTTLTTATTTATDRITTDDMARQPCRPPTNRRRPHSRHRPARHRPPQYDDRWPMR